MSDNIFSNDIINWDATFDNIEKKIRSEERERCAKIAEEYKELRISDGDEVCNGIAKAIREQG